VLRFGLGMEAGRRASKVSGGLSVVKGKTRSPALGAKRNFSRAERQRCVVLLIIASYCDGGGMERRMRSGGRRGWWWTSTACGDAF